MPVTKGRGGELGEAGGYESGYFRGKIAGAVTATGTAGAVIAGGTVTVAAAPAVAVVAIIGGLGYLVGGAAGGYIGSWRGKKAGENKAVEPGAPDEAEVFRYAKEKGGDAGMVAGGIAGIAVGYVGATAVEQGLLEVVSNKIGGAIETIPDINLNDIPLAGNVCNTGTSVI